ncbi:MAG: glycosyltransferase [Chloroflexi bacterium]|nr:glycosyltransferase [Chloroflexota bacterium]
MGETIRDTAIVITTFLRDAALFRCVESIRKFYPDIAIFVGDNGQESAFKANFLKAQNCTYFPLPFDIGVSGVRNETLKLIPPQYEYLFIAEDDFVFTDKSKLERLRAVLDAEPTVGLCGCLLYLKDGTEQHYEARMWRDGDTLFVKRVRDVPEPKVTKDGTQYLDCYDLILNAFMMRRAVWLDRPWDAQFKTALEHSDFFMGLQTDTKWRVAYTRDVSMTHLTDQSGEYGKYRTRPVGWKLFGEKWGLKFVNSDYSKEQPLSYEAIGAGKSVDLKGENLKLAVNVLNANKCIWWLEAGTCLGAIRENGFIPYDPDIDIGLHPKELPKWGKLQVDMLAAGFELYRAWTHGKRNIELSYKRNGIKLDLFFFYDGGDGFWWHGAFGPNPVTGGWGEGHEFLPHVFTASFFQDLKPFVLNGIPCFVPDPAKRYLIERYGPMWPHRQPGYKYWTDCRAIDRNYFKKGAKVVYIGGVWDLFHEGHLAILERAKAIGTRLVVGVLTDEAAMVYKARPIIPFEARKRIVESLKCVDKVIAQNAKDPTADLGAAGIAPHYLIHGDDWESCPGELYVRAHKGKVVFLPYTPGISSTEIRKWVAEGHGKIVAKERNAAIAVGIKTFMRAPVLWKSIEAIKTYCPYPYRLYIADDGPQDDDKRFRYQTLKAEGHEIIPLPFDSGISIGRNAIIKAATEDYVLIADDDVALADKESLTNMKAVLDSAPEIGIVAAVIKGESGAYFASEGYAKGVRFERIGNLLKRTPASQNIQRVGENGPLFIVADQVPNFFIAKREVFDEVKWDNRIRIEHEHVSFFLDLQKTQWKAAVCLNANAVHLTHIPERGYEMYRRNASPAYLYSKHGFTRIVNQF